MVAFARFVMRDNGLAIHINATAVTQVRQTTEGEPAIYITGRESPMVVEGTLDAAIRKLEAAAAGIKVVEPAFEVAEPSVAETPALVAKPPMLELVSSEEPAAPEVAPDPVPETEIVEAPKAKPMKAKAGAKTKAAKAKATKAAAPVPQEPEIPYPSASWFMGNR